MRERTRLETSIGAVRDLETNLNDNRELIEMGEAEGDEGIVAEAEAALKVSLAAQNGLVLFQHQKTQVRFVLTDSRTQQME